MGERGGGLLDAGIGGRGEVVRADPPPDLLPIPHILPPLFLPPHHPPTRPTPASLQNINRSNSKSSNNMPSPLDRVAAVVEGGCRRAGKRSGGCPFFSIKPSSTMLGICLNISRRHHQCWAFVHAGHNCCIPYNVLSDVEEFDRGDFSLVFVSRAEIPTAGFFRLTGLLGI